MSTLKELELKAAALQNEIKADEQALLAKKTELSSLLQQIGTLIEKDALAKALYPVGTVFVSPYGIEYVSRERGYIMLFGEKQVVHWVDIVKDPFSIGGHIPYLENHVVSYKTGHVLPEKLVGTRFFTPDNKILLPDKKLVSSAAKKLGAVMGRFLRKKQLPNFFRTDSDKLYLETTVDMQGSLPHLAIVVAPRRCYEHMVPAKEDSGRYYLLPKEVANLEAKTAADVEALKTATYAAETLFKDAGYPTTIEMQTVYSSLMKNASWEVPVLKVFPKPAYETAGPEPAPLDEAA